MSSERAGQIICKAASECGFIAENYPIADGGEGTVDAFQKLIGGEKIFADTFDPYFNELNAEFLLSGETAVIEMALCAGMALKAPFHNIEDTATYGVGRLIECALDLGAERIIIGNGGSITNDGGCGMAAALGVKFIDDENKQFIPVSGTLKRIKKVDISRLDKRIKDTEIIAMVDVQNPLYGPSGAAYVYSPQKGADERQVTLLDEGLIALDKAVYESLGIKADTPGDGAAGGLAYALRVFLGAGYRKGIDLVLDEMDFDAKVKNYDFVVTGEGKLDTQSLSGKAVIGIAKRARKAGVPVISFSGIIEGNLADVYAAGLTAAFATNLAGLPFEKAKSRCESDLYMTAKNVFLLLK